MQMQNKMEPAHQGQQRILPKQVCECWKKRRILPVEIQECWYCRYADFGWEKEIADDVGTCRYPNPQI